MIKKIALEEHFLAPGFEEYLAPALVNIDPAIYDRLYAQLVDFAGGAYVPGFGMYAAVPRFRMARR